MTRSMIMVVAMVLAAGAGCSDDPEIPRIAFASTTGTLPEQGAQATVDVTLTIPPTAALSAAVSVTGGTATEGVDFTLVDSTLTFAPGATTGTIRLAVVNDALDEDDETVELTLADPVGGALGLVSKTTITIVDDDPEPNVAFVSTTAHIGETGGTLEIPIALDALSSKPITVQVSVTGGTATTGADFTFSGGTVTFAPGESMKTIQLVAISDFLDEPDETVTLALSSPTNAALGTAAETVTIQDETDVPVVQFDSASSSTAEGAGVKTLTVTMSSPSAVDVTVHYDVTAGTAEAGDFTAASATLTIPAFATSATLNVQILNDPNDEPDDTVLVTLSSPTGATIGAIAQHTVTITDDDNPPTITFASAIGSGAEATSPAVSVSVSVASEFQISFDVAVTGGTATQGTDYTFAAGTISIPPFATSTTVPIAVTDDNVDELNETVSISMSNPTLASLGAIAGFTYTILDDDNAPTVQFSATGGSGAESVTSGMMTVTLSAASSKTITVAYTTGGSATSGGIDYTVPPSPLVFTPGQTQLNIPFTINDDLVTEPSETMVVTISNNPLNAILGAQSVFTYTILDND